MSGYPFDPRPPAAPAPPPPEVRIETHVVEKDRGCFGCAVLILLVVIACSVTGCCRDEKRVPRAPVPASSP